MAEKLPTLSPIKAFLVYTAQIIYTFIVFFFFFMSFVIGHSPLGCDPSVLQAVIQLTTFLLYNEQLSMSE